MDGKYLREDKTILQIQQMLFLLFKTGVVDLQKASPNTRRFIESVLKEWGEEWRKEAKPNGNTNENPA